MSVSGSATFTGLTVDLWDGQQWWAVANGSGTAQFALEDGTAAVTLVPASELPAGDYTQIRLTATDAVIDLTTGDGSQQFSAQLQSNGPVVITKSVTVTVNPDGSRDRKSTRLNSSHVRISYAVFCLKKKNHPPPPPTTRLPSLPHPPRSP